MALLELAKAFIGKDKDFTLKVAGACLMAAKDIADENPVIENHAGRLAWAIEVKKNPVGKATEMLIGVLKNATIAADVANATDNDIQFVVNSLINKYAG